MAGLRQGGRQEGEQKPQRKVWALPPVDTLLNDPARIRASLIEAIPPLAGTLEERHAQRLACLDGRSVEETVLNIVSAVAYLDSKGMYNSRDEFIERIPDMLSQDPWKVYQAGACAMEFPSDVNCHLFLIHYFPQMGKHIFWKPFIDKLNEYDEDSVLRILLFGSDFENYIKEWDKSIAMAEQAVHEFGLAALPSVELGRSMRLERSGGDEFFTTTEGVISIPPYISLYDTRERNLLHYRISFWHELGHHKWNTFRVNMDPEAFDYDSFGLTFLGRCEGRDGSKGVRVKDAAGNEREIAAFEDVIASVEKPELLMALQNFIDDGRVDGNNMLYCLGISQEYKEDVEFLFDKAEPLSGAPVVQLYKAIAHYSIVGRVKGTLPEEMEGPFAKAKEAIDSMCIGFESDGTDSLNAAIKVYRIIEEELKKAGSQMQDRDLDYRIRPSNTGSKGTKLVIERPAEKEQGRPGVNPAPLGDGPSGKGRKRKPTGSPGGQGGGEELGGDERGDGPAGSGHGRGSKNARDPKAEERAFIYDGWDGDRLIAGEHKVVERKAEGHVMEPGPAEVERVRRIFLKYAPREAVLERGVDEGETDPELLAAYLEDLRNLRIGERDFHCRVVYEERDVGTGVLIDLSGSTLGIRDEILSACGILGTASDALKDPLIVAGFTDDGSEGFIVMKDLHEKGIRTSEAQGGTPIGGPLRHMCHRMQAPGIKHKGFKQIFLITDGEANTGKEPMKDAAKAVLDAKRKERIAVFGIGITYGDHGGKQMEKDFDEIFGIGNYLLVSADDVRSGTLHHFFEGYYRKLVNRLR